MRLISLRLPDTIISRMSTTPYIMQKYNIVFIMAAFDTTNRNLVRSASKRLAIKILIPCEAAIPTIRPAAMEIIPITTVSIIRIAATFTLPIPRIRYIPNSLLRLLIRKVLAYTMRKPRTTATNTLITDIMLPSVSINETLLSLIFNITA